MSWPHPKLSRVCTIAKGQVDPTLEPYSSMPLVAPNHVESGTGRLTEVETAEEQGAISGKYLCQPGDVIYSKIRPALRKAAMAVEPCLTSADMYPLHPAPGMEGRFLMYYLLCDKFSHDTALASDRVAMPKINREALNEIRVPKPPMQEQQAIADYLDTETTRIDNLITKKQRLMDAVEERFWADVVARMDAASAPRVPLRRLLTWITDGPFGSSLTSAHYSDAGARVVRLGNIGHGYFRDVDRAFIPMDDYDQLRRHRVREGDLLVAGLGDDRNHVGRACVAPNLGPAIVKADCYCIRLHPGLAMPEFVALYLSSPQGAEEVAAYGRGSTRTRINTTIAREVPVPLPPLAEQEAIVDLSRRERERTRRLRKGIDRQLDLLREHRQALVTAAVTGELEVPGVAA